VFVIFRNGAARGDHPIAANSSIDPVSAYMPRLEIRHAVYAAKDGSGEVDVTSKLTGLVRDSQLSVAANNELVGHDPASDHVKELRVDFTLDGKPGHATIPENNVLVLPEKTNLGQSPLWETRVADNGSTFVKLWSDGEVNLQTAGGSALHASAENVPAPQEVTGGWNSVFRPTGAHLHRWILTS